MTNTDSQWSIPTSLITILHDSIHCQYTSYILKEETIAIVIACLFSLLIISFPSSLFVLPVDVISF